MIKIAIISLNAKAELLLLAQHTEMQVSYIIPSALEQVVQQVATLAPNIIVIDHELENVSADILCHFLNKKCPDAQSIMLIETQPSFEMLESTGFKVRGFLTTEQRPLLAKAIRVVHDGEAWLPRKLVTEMLNQFSKSVINTKALQLSVI